MYEEVNASLQTPNASNSLFGWPRSVVNSQSSDASTSKVFSHYLNVDPFLYEALRGPTIDIGMSQEAQKILGSVDDVRLMSEKYFDTIWTRFPIVCSTLFRRRLPSVYLEPRADYILLCLAIHLIVQLPASEHCSMQSSTYVAVKANIALLESANYVTLHMLQARLLAALYEMGHGISPAASISIGGCGRLMHALGLNAKEFHNVPPDDTGKMRAEDEKRVRWGTILLDRYVVTPPNLSMVLESCTSCFFSLCHTIEVRAHWHQIHKPPR